MLPALRGRRDTADLGPKLESPGPGGSVVGGGNVLAVEREEVVDLVVRREEPLGLAGGFEPLHLPFASTGRLVRILGSVVQTFPGFPIWIRPTRPKALETLAKLRLPPFTLRVRHDSAT